MADWGKQSKLLFCIPTEIETDIYETVVNQGPKYERSFSWLTDPSDRSNVTFVYSEMPLILTYRISTMKRPEFGGILKMYKFFFQVLRVPCLLKEYKSPPKYLGYLTGHGWGAPTVLTEKCINCLN
jgi:hypothetical protein